MTRKVKWPHLGEILLHEFLEPMGITQYRLAKERIADVLSRIRRSKDAPH